MRRLCAPYLVRVKVRALVGLELVAIVHSSTGEIEALSFVEEGDAVVAGVVPLLRGKIIVASPDFHANAIAWVVTSVEAEVRASKPHFRLSLLDGPLLSVRSVAIIDLNWCAIGDRTATYIHTLPIVAIRMNGGAGNGCGNRRSGRAGARTHR